MRDGEIWAKFIAPHPNRREKSDKLSVQKQENRHPKTDSDWKC